MVLSEDGEGQRARHKTIGLISSTIAGSAQALYVSVHFFAVPAKQQREMTKFKVLWRTGARAGEISFLCVNLDLCFK